MISFLSKKFIKNYDNPKDPTVRLAYGKLAGLVGIVCNLLLFGAKMAVGLISGSVSITADAINNLSDASASIVTLVGFKLAEKPADEDHPYGHARMEYLAGLVVAAMILFIGWELAKSSVLKIIHPGEVTFSLVLVAVLLLSILGKAWLGLFNHKLGQKIDSSTLRATAADCRNDVLTTSAVLACAVISHLTSLNLDGYVGVLVALFIFWSGITIAKDTINPLLGEAPTDELRQAMADTILACPKVLGIHDMMVHDYGPGRRFASVHVEMDSRENPLECHEIIDDLERDVEQLHNVHLVIHYDPVITDDGELNRMRDLVTTYIRQVDSRLSIHDFRMVPGSGHTNLIFDAVMPYDMDGRKKEVTTYINEKLAQEEMTYYAVITFDHVTFNQ